MASSTLTGKLEADVDIKASPEQFHEIKKVICLDGKAKKAKEVVEAVDPDKNLITFRVIEGDLMEEYKSFVAMILVSPKSEDSGSIVHWTLEYEKLHDGIAHPETLRQLV
ncbi:hypothetical protein ES319_A03G159700v1 [Gossypium barbadense]|uniref:Bet v I/Major latex protein domain-containing protein n=1 Tax=Gossypium barbadense TaxID=3634 RepID=A0A5J5WGI0_GOSBA|nr:hypothetical protein ES319_A03G159700v1 [Gossypium barbadense]